METTEKNLDYYRKNAEEDYLTTPISVLRYISEMESALRQQPVVRWVAFDWGKIETRPAEYGKYLICRKDGKIHWETWNGSGWAYNHNEIRYWAVIVPPSNIIRELKNSNLSIQFAEWLSENEWVKRTKTHPNKVGQYYSHKHCEYKTIEQLFDVFSSVT